MGNYDPKLTGGITDKGLYRAENEDALWQPDRTTPVQLGALYIVADGVGGQAHGGIAARMSVAVLSDGFYRARTNGLDISEALKVGIAEANQAVFDEAQLSGLKMGATVVTAVHDQGQLYIAHVGDSRAYLVADEALTLLTRDDSYVQRQLDAGLITPAEAAQHQFRNLVTQVLGNTLDIDIHLAEPRPFSEGEALLLCTDGLSGVVAPEAIFDIVTDNLPSQAAVKLIQAAKDAGSQDNITAVVVKQSSLQTPFVPTPTIADKPKREKSVWLWAGMVVFLIVVTAFLWWWRSQEPAAGNDLVEATAVPLVLPAADDETATPALQTAVPEASTTPTPDQTRQHEIMETAVAVETSAFPATATSEPTAIPANLGCVDPAIEIVYVWAQEDLTAETCAAVFAQLSLSAGEPVLILETTPIPLPAPGYCIESDFVEIKSRADETIIGWVLDSQILRDETCP